MCNFSNSIDVDGYHRKIGGCYLILFSTDVFFVRRGHGDHSRCTSRPCLTRWWSTCWSGSCPRTWTCARWNRRRWSAAASTSVAATPNYGNSSAPSKHRFPLENCVRTGEISFELIEHVVVIEHTASIEHTVGIEYTRLIGHTVVTELSVSIEHTIGHVAAKLVTMAGIEETGRVFSSYPIKLGNLYDIERNPCKWLQDCETRPHSSQNLWLPIRTSTWRWKYSRIRLYHPRDISSSRLYWPFSAGTEFLHYKTSWYIIQPSGYIGHFERCQREHLRA